MSSGSEGKYLFLKIIRLQFYLTNLRKMNKLTKTEITELDTEIKQLTIMTADFLVHHNTNVDKHNYILETIKKNFERQSEIDNKVAATNSLIYQSKNNFIYNFRY